ncbi:RDD family protein [Cloacibacterium sp.]|uniref:RDD family protein n=1 Tax=Cloacibacterium sp. TaxID=1913682 RepID=UPI0035B317FC
MAQIDINTSQNVNLSFTVANLGERLLAFIVDTVIKVILGFILAYILFNFLRLDNFIKGWDQFSIMGFYAIISSPFILYPLIFESLMEGQTPGKKVFKIKVVKVDGFQASFSDYLIRWIFRLIDFGFFFIPGLISMTVNKYNLRLGDIASGTAVISLKNNINISHTILEKIDSDYIPTFPQVISLTDNDVRIIKENFVNAKNGQDRQIITKLANKILETLKLNRDDIPLTESKFIDTIIKDYNFYTGKDV